MSRLTITSLALATLGLLSASPTHAQPVAAQRPPQGEYGCEVQKNNPCQGRVDFNVGKSFEFKIPGPGDVTFENKGNKRCVLEYSITESTLAATGRQLSLGPGQNQVLTVRDAGGMVIRFFNRGIGSSSCELTVGLS